MKEFLIVLKFELNTMMRKRSFIISTLLIVIGAFFLLSLPGFFQDLDQADSDEESSEVSDRMIICDKNKVINDKTLVAQMFPDYQISYEDDERIIRNAVEQEEADAGFVIHNDRNFTYYVKNSSLMDMTSDRFSEFLQQNYQLNELKRLNYNVDRINEIYQEQVLSNVEVLGTDGSSNYFYTYVLVLLLYMMIMIYGNQIAVGVASEKSNRAIEILTTSCSPNSLIFGKVIAGALTGIIQTAIIIGSVLAAYQLNADSLNHILDPYLQIPSTVMVTFTLFGILGYLLFSFILGAIGAMCSKVEEVNGATLPVQLAIIAVFTLSMIVLQTPDGLLAKIMMYLPFTSWMCMFVNVAVSSVSIVEIAISLILLALTTIFMGLLGAKLYRRGTLTYGNTLKLSTMLKALKHED